VFCRFIQSLSSLFKMFATIFFSIRGLFLSGNLKVRFVICFDRHMNRVWK